MNKSVVILGRQAAISLAELEAVFGANKISNIYATSAVLDIPYQDVSFNRLGGVIKLGQVIGFTTVDQLSNHLIDLVNKLNLPKQGKLHIGISAYDLKLHPKDVNKLTLKLKAKLKAKGQNVRAVPNRDNALNTAQVWHNHLIKENGLELLLIGQDNQVIVAKTTHVQDIKSYTIRDRSRPKRDTKVGMLPPKLAQTIINLAVGNQELTKAYLLDPFCGTGVILQEALLMGYNVVGSDINPRMIEYSIANLEWLAKQYPLKANFNVIAGDALTTTWKNLPIFVVASETYLGPQLPTETQLPNIINELNLLHKKFLQNLATQIPSGTRLCLAVPAWCIKGKFLHLPTLDQLPKLGYNRLAFKYANFNQLIYHRPGQIVGRELVVLTKE